MSSKKVIEVNYFNEKELNQTFKDGFLYSLENDTIKIQGNKIYMTGKNEDYVGDINQFMFTLKPSLENIFEKQIATLFKNPNELEPWMIKSLYDWSNPFFDELPEKIDAKEKFQNDLKEKMKDKKYADSVRTEAIKYLKHLGVDRRKDYIDRLEPLGIYNDQDKIRYGYYSDLHPDQLSRLFKEKKMPERQQVGIVSQAFVLARDKEKTNGRKHKKEYNSRIIQLINLLPADEILDVYMSKTISQEEFVRSKVTKDDILSLDEVDIIKFLAEKNDELPEKLKITSQDLVNEYGKKFNGSTIDSLATFGYIRPQDLIEIYDINKALRAAHYDSEELFDDEELKAFYCPEIFIEMKRNNEITPRFIQKYLELENFEKHPEVFKTKSENLADSIVLYSGNIEKGDPEKLSQETILYFYDIGLIDINTAKSNVRVDLIDEKYSNGEIDVQDILRYYQKGFLGEKEISKYFSEDEILKLYEEGKVRGDALKVVYDPDLLTQEFCDGKISDSDFVRLYLESDNLNINDFNDALELSEREVETANFITEKTPFSKIKELFTRYIIDYSSVIGLHNQGIISDDQFNELKSAMNTKKFFEEIESGKIYKVVTSREGQAVSKTHGVAGSKTQKNFGPEINLISELLEKKVEDEQYSLIESYNIKGKPTSLNNYRIFGNEDLDGIVILQKSKKENAVYVMSALQMMYFLKGKENEDGTIAIQNRMKDKAYLKTIEGVKVIEHTEYFARNLVEAASEISPKIAKKVKSNDRNYVESVDQMVSKMREDYLEEKAKGRDED